MNAKCWCNTHTHTHRNKNEQILSVFAFQACVSVVVVVAKNKHNAKTLPFHCHIWQPILRFGFCGYVARCMQPHNINASIYLLISVSPCTYASVCVWICICVCTATHTAVLQFVKLCGSRRWIVEFTSAHIHTYNWFYARVCVCACVHMKVCVYLLISCTRTPTHKQVLN